jgi:hypothetical protein
LAAVAIAIDALIQMRAPVADLLPDLEVENRRNRR